MIGYALSIDREGCEALRLARNAVLSRLYRLSASISRCNWALA